MYNYVYEYVYLMLGFCIPPEKVESNKNERSKGKP